MRRLSACRKKSVFYKIEQIIYHYKNALWVLRLCNRGRLLSVRPAPTLFDHLFASLHRAFGRSISASLPKPPNPFPRGEGLCMLSWLCICAIVVVCCRCVLHRLCSTTCLRPCIEPLGIHARRPCRAECGAAALTPLGATPQTPFLTTIEVFQQPDSLRFLRRLFFLFSE